MAKLTVKRFSQIMAHGGKFLDQIDGEVGDVQCATKSNLNFFLKRLDAFKKQFDETVDEVCYGLIQAGAKRKGGR